MPRTLHPLGAGFLFGIGLWVSGMANPRKVLDFLDVAGDWDPSLLLVMGGAVAVTLVAFRPLLNRKPMQLKSEIDTPLIVGAAVFGVGWGIGGYCPGPALTALSNLTAEVFVFVAAMVAGGVFAGTLPRTAHQAIRSSSRSNGAGRRSRSGRGRRAASRRSRAPR